tara:strand:- start:13916 stop:14797 length:882 start_codon:yes stop_codon:yes gene_type:complete
MKTFIKINLFVFSLIFASCQDVIEIDVPVGATELVISGQISDKDSAYVQLSTTSPYFSQGETRVISGARVSIWKGNAEMALLSESISKPGFYSSNFQGSIGEIYHIEVDISGDYPRSTLGTWVSKSDTLRACPPLDSLVQATLSRTTTPRAFEEGEYALMFFGDIPDTKNYYRVKRTLNDSAFAREIIIFDDFGLDGAYFGGGEFPPVSIYGPFEEDKMDLEKDTLVVRVESISDDFQSFLTLVSSQDQVGSPFDAPPALVVGNIHRKDNEREYAFGYFSVVGTNSNGLRYKP